MNGQLGGFCSFFAGGIWVVIYISYSGLNRTISIDDLLHSYLR